MELTNRELMLVEISLKRCMNFGNIPTQLATSKNLRRVRTALKEPRELIDTDEEMKYFVDNIQLAKDVDGFNFDEYAFGESLKNADDGTVFSDTEKDAIAYADANEDRIEALRGFDKEKFDAGEQKIKDLEAETNKDFEPYLYNLEKLSEDLGDDRINAALVHVLNVFGQGE